MPAGLPVEIRRRGGSVETLQSRIESVSNGLRRCEHSSSRPSCPDKIIESSMWTSPAAKNCNPHKSVATGQAFLQVPKPVPLRFVESLRQ